MDQAERDRRNRVARGLTDVETMVRRISRYVVEGQDDKAQELMVVAVKDLQDLNTGVDAL